ncbi:hypothetical protein RMS29_005835 [Agrobacterium rosae]|uniref:hypothetical protein n=1 Tax=Agrobacterium rosae TaxID=1972867 RepID=UPI003D7B8411
MFGSSLRGVGQDIDILIVGPTGEALAKLKKEVSQAGHELPLHVMYMLPSEADETGFVTNERCISLLELASGSNHDLWPVRRCLTPT